MEILMVQFNIKPGKVDDFLAASADDGRGSISHEYGCHRFDVIQNDSEPNRVAFCEVYDDHAAVENHLTMPHFKEWRDTVGDWYAEPATGAVRGSNYWPPDNWGWSSGRPTA